MVQELHQKRLSNQKDKKQPKNSIFLNVFFYFSVINAVKAVLKCAVHYLMAYPQVIAYTFFFVN